jgi:thioredoxin 1
LRRSIARAQHASSVEYEEITMASDKIPAVSDATFDAEVLASDRPVLVKFEADWCGPCHAIAPMIEEVAGEYGERVRVVRLDVDANNRTPYRFGVRSIPTLMLFKGGNLAAQKVGAHRKAELTAMLDSQL